MSKYLFSVLTPSFNQGQFVAQNLASVQQQTEPYEHIVMDGGSTDATLAVLARYPTVKFRSEPDRGQSDALLKALALSTGNVVCWLNSDDYLEPDALSEVRRVMDATGAKVVVGAVRFVDENGCEQKVFPGETLSAEGLRDYTQCVLQPGTFVARECIERVGFVDQRYHYIMDHEWLYRVASAYSTATTPSVLANFRLHPESKTVSRKSRFLMEMLRFKWRAGARWSWRRDGRAIARIVFDETIGRWR